RAQRARRRRLRSDAGAALRGASQIVLVVAHELCRIARRLLDARARRLGAVARLAREPLDLGARGLRRTARLARAGAGGDARGPRETAQRTAERRLVRRRFARWLVRRVEGLAGF